MRAQALHLAAPGLILAGGRLVARCGILTGGRLVARGALAAVFLLAALASSAATALGADPTGSPGTGGDVRTNPAAPGLVGDPLFAVIGVAVVGLVAVVATLAAMRLADRR